MAAAAPDAVAPPPGNPRFPLLDGTRAVAAFMVVLTHAGTLTTFSETNALGGLTARMNVGVTLFFLLSGFLLYRPFVAARLEDRPPIRLLPYLWRRALRIIPAYWVALTVLAIWPGLPGFWDGPWWQCYLFVNIYDHYTFLMGIDPAWSLAVEVTFYLALPMLALIIGRVARRSVPVELALLGALALASLTTRALLPMDHVLQNSILTHLDWFALGMALATVSVATWGGEARFGALRVVGARPWVPWLAAAAVLLLVSYGLGLPRGYALPDTRLDFLSQHVLYALFAALVLAPAIFGAERGGAPRRLLGLPTVAWLGLVSYGVFLWHLPLMKWLQEQGADEWLPGSGFVSLLVPTVIVSVAVAAASYSWLERPVLRLKGRGSSASTRRWAARDSAPDAAAATARQATELSGSSSAASRASSNA